jgi:chromosomal replication initiation ATPase DnaA
MGQPEGEALLEKLRQGGSHGHILGDDDFLNRVLPRDSISDTQDGPNVSLDDLTARVAQACRVSEEGILSKSKSRSLVQARTILAILAVDHHHFTLKVVAHHLGRNEATISRQINKNRGQALPF